MFVLPLRAMIIGTRGAAAGAFSIRAAAPSLVILLPLAIEIIGLGREAEGF